MEVPASTRLAELSVALSLATDLGTGQPLEHGLRTCVLSVAAGRVLGVDDAALSSVFHVALLRFAGCTSDASETAIVAGGDDVGLNAEMAPMLLASPGEGLAFVVRHLGEGLAWPARIGRVLSAMADPGMDRRSLSGHCEVAARLAARLGVDAAIERALAHAYERWDGRGYPDGLAGEDVPVEVRVVTVARDVELWFRHGGWPAVVEVLGHRRDRGYDPAVVDAFLAEGRKWLEGVSDDLCARVFDIEPRPVATLGSVTVDEALAAMADFADMKSPWFLGRSPAVSVLADAAAGLSGLDDEERIGLRRAALVHDIGRVGVPSGIWDQSRPLTSEQWERVRLHPYLSERVLGRCKVLEPHAPLAGRHHERGDGSGYHRGMTAAGLTPSDDILAAADTYQAMIEPRSYRPARSASEAAGLLIEQVNEGRLSHRAVDAVLGAAGHHSRPANVRRPASLTEREVDVLRLLARGRSNRAIAAELSISPKTVGHHVEHIYTKTGVNTRAGATLFAVETGLVGARTRP